MPVLFGGTKIDVVVPMSAVCIMAVLFGADYLGGKAVLRFWAVPISAVRNMAVLFGREAVLGFSAVPPSAVPGTTEKRREYRQYRIRPSKAEKNGGKYPDDYLF